MTLKENIIKVWEFLNEDSWQSMLVSVILIILFIKLIFFPVLSLITGSSLPLVVVESCSMYHGNNINTWWNSYSGWYDYKNISKKTFISFPFLNGLNKGDIIFVSKPKNLKEGDVIIFTTGSNSTSRYPIIHRIISLNPIQTKGDNNRDQLRGSNNLGGVDETNISENQLVGKAIFRIPSVGWIKLIFFEPFRNPEGRGFCKSS